MASTVFNLIFQDFKAKMLLEFERDVFTDTMSKAISELYSACVKEFSQNTCTGVCSFI